MSIACSSDGTKLVAVVNGGGVYTYAAPGSLQVTITPVGAINAGAQWQVDGGSWQKSGATVNNLSIGNHTLIFKPVSAWTTPASQTVSVSGNAIATASGTYVVIPTGLGAFIAGLYDTGVNNGGTLATLETSDSHYALVSVPSGGAGTAWVVPPFPSAWCAGTTNANWLSPTLGSAGGIGYSAEPGNYDYRLLFSMADGLGHPLDPTTATITGNWAADDVATLLLNGAPVATNNTGFSGLSSFSVSSGFRVGTNTLDVVVINAGTAPNPSGLLVSGLSGTAALVKEAPPSIATQPANESPALGGVASFSVKATGTPLTYQWFFDGAPLSDNRYITGSASNRLTINQVTSNDVGSYSVVVANSYVAVTSRVVQLTLSRETTKPSVGITSPKANSRTNAPVLSGTASDSVRVLNVAYWVTNVNGGVITTANGLAALTAGAGASSNWTIQTPLLPGTNILAVQSSNYAGLASAVERATFFYRVRTPLQLQVNPPGMGQLTGVASVRGDPAPANGAALYVGEGYSLTAAPAFNWYLTNWLTNGGIAGTNRTLNFIMESNLTVTANFETNLFVGAAARYDGIFYPSSPVPETVTNSGLIYNLVLGTNGVFTGKMYLASATPYTLSGAFDRSGQAVETIGRSAAAGGNVTLQLNIPWGSVPRQITGSVQGSNAGGWISTNLNLYAAATNTSNVPAYTALLPQDTNVPGSPPNYGYALITNMAGMIHVGGALSDGTAFSSFVEPINERDGFPVYASLYNNTGLLLGQLSLDAGSNAAVPAGNLAWFKPPSHTGLYSNGFTASLDVAGSPWTNSAAALVGLFPEGAQLTFSGSGLASNLVSTVQLTSSNTFRRVSGSADFASGTIKPANGLMTLTFTNTSGKKVTASGTLLQNAGMGGGFFLGATNAGSVLLQP